jgi:hypothetical protein
MRGQWYVAGAMFIISTALLRLVAARLAAANPSERLPWIGTPPNKPRGILPLQFVATFSLVLGVRFVATGFQDRGIYDALWGVPFAVIVFLVGLAVPFRRHNRRVRHAS